MRYKISLGSNCNLRCKYCFIDKEKGESLSEETARRTVDWILSRPERQQQIDLYGGEPLLYFRRLKQIVEHVRKEAPAAKKNVRLAVATNGAFIRKTHLDFFRRHEIEICISLESLRSNAQRITKDGKPARREAWQGAGLAAKIMPPGLLTALLCVHPSQTGTLAEDFAFLITRGFHAVNVEVILGVSWSGRRRRQFIAEFLKIAAAVHKSIADGNPIFLQSACRHLLTGIQPPSIEIYPDGTPGQAPYPFSHLPNNPTASLLEGNDVLKMRDKLSLQLAREISRRAIDDKNYARYIMASRERYEGLKLNH